MWVTLLWRYTWGRAFAFFRGSRQTVKFPVRDETSLASNVKTRHNTRFYEVLSTHHTLSEERWKTFTLFRHHSQLVERSLKFNLQLHVLVHVHVAIPIQQTVIFADFYVVWFGKNWRMDESRLSTRIWCLKIENIYSSKKYLCYL